MQIVSMARRWFMLAVACVAVTATTDRADAQPLPLPTVVIYVDQSVSSPGDGTLAAPYKALQDAFDKALMELNDPIQPETSEIRIAPGIYKPDLDLVCHFGGLSGCLNHVNNSRTESFVLIQGIWVRGGYPSGFGAGTSPTLPPSTVVLTGDIGDLPSQLDSHDPVPFSGMGENSLHVMQTYFPDDLTGGATVENLTITAGNANLTAADWHDSGGGVLFVFEGAVPELPLSFRSCTFSRSSANASGGGVATFIRTSMVFRGCLVEDNRTLDFLGAQGGGGIYSEGAYGLTIVGTTFARNSAARGHGGGLHGFTAPFYVGSSSFIDNVAANGSGGGMYGGGLTVNCIFTGNSANGTGAFGRGGGHSGGEVIAGCTFAENTARHGGGLYISGGVVQNCILYFNDATVVEGCSGFPLQQWTKQANFQAGIERSCIQDWVWSPCFAGGSDPLNTDDNPMFRNLAGGNLRLTAASTSSIDAGNDAFVPPDTENVDEDSSFTEPTPDRDILERITFGLFSHDVDHGAYEYVPKPPCPEDLNRDGEVNGLDLAVLLAAWGPCDDCAADLDEDGVVNGLDLAILLAAWGRCPESLTGGGSGGEGGESSATSGGAPGSGCGGGIDLFQHWLDSGDMDAFWQWYDCLISGGLTQ
jgi:Dockerin type I domain